MIRRLQLICCAAFLISATAVAEEASRCFIHTDRDIYTIGDDVYYKIYLQEGLADRARGGAKLMYVDLVAPDSSIVMTQKIRLMQGSGHGDFVVGVRWASGRYTLRGYTNSMMANSQASIFRKTLEIHSYAKVDPPSGTKGGIDLQFFPVSGHLVAGIESAVGIKATTGAGMGVMTSGTIKGSGEDIAFSTDSMGFAKVKVQPFRGERMQANFMHNDKQQTADLPLPLPSGYVLELESKTDDITVLKVSASEDMIPADLMLVLRQYDQTFQEMSLPLRGQVQAVSLDVSEAKPGVLSATLIDAAQRPHAEILIFHYGDLWDHFLEMDLASSGVGVREEVDVILESFDFDGEAIAAELSISIVDERYLKAGLGDVRSHLLLGSEIAGRVKNVSQYFDAEPDVCRQRMQNLLLTQGWRRYTWLTPSEDQGKSSPLDGITLRGRVLNPDSNGKGIAARGFVSELSENLTMMPFRTDEQGYFSIRDLQIDGTQNLLIQAARTGKVKIKNQDELKLSGNRNVDIELLPVSSLAVQAIDISHSGQEAEVPLDQKAFDFVENNASQVNLATSQWNGLSVTTDTVEVKAQRVDPLIEAYEAGMAYNRPNQRLMMDEIPARARFQSVMDIIRARVPSAEVTTLTSGDARAGAAFEPRVRLRARSNLSKSTDQTGYATFLLNGMTISASSVLNIRPENIAFIDVISSLSNLAAYGSAGSGGIIAIYLVPPGHRVHTIEAKEGQLNVSFQGYYQAREFYVPKYSQGQDMSEDDRVTLYWNPSLSLSSGEASIRTFSSDRRGEFVIVAQGVTTDGLPLYCRQKLSVE